MTNFFVLIVTAKSAIGLREPASAGSRGPSTGKLSPAPLLYRLLTRCSNFGRPSVGKPRRTSAASHTHCEAPCRGAMLHLALAQLLSELPGAGAECLPSSSFCARPHVAMRAAPPQHGSDGPAVMPAQLAMTAGVMLCVLIVLRLLLPRREQGAAAKYDGRAVALRLVSPPQPGSSKRKKSKRKSMEGKVVSRPVVLQPIDAPDQRTESHPGGAEEQRRPMFEPCSDQVQSCAQEDAVERQLFIDESTPNDDAAVLPSSRLSLSPTNSSLARESEGEPPIVRTQERVARDAPQLPQLLDACSGPVPDGDCAASMAASAMAVPNLGASDALGVRDGGSCDPSPSEASAAATPEGSSREESPMEGSREGCLHRENSSNVASLDLGPSAEQVVTAQLIAASRAADALPAAHPPGNAGITVADQVDPLQPPSPLAAAATETTSNVDDQLRDSQCAPSKPSESVKRTVVLPRSILRSKGGGSSSVPMSPTADTPQNTPSPKPAVAREGLWVSNVTESAPELQEASGESDSKDADASLTLAVRRQGSIRNKLFAAQLSIVTPSALNASPPILRLMPAMPPALAAAGVKPSQPGPGARFSRRCLASSAAEEVQSYRSSTTSGNNSADANSDNSGEGGVSPYGKQPSQRPIFVFQSLAEHLEATSWNASPVPPLEHYSPPPPNPTPLMRHPYSESAPSPARCGFWVRTALRSVMLPSSCTSNAVPPASPTPPGLTPRAPTPLLHGAPPGLLKFPLPSAHQSPDGGANRLSTLDSSFSDRECQWDRASLSGHASTSEPSLSLRWPLERKAGMRSAYVGFTQEVLDAHAQSTTPSATSSNWRAGSLRAATPTTPTMANRLRHSRRSPRQSPGGKAPWTMPGAYEGSPTGRRSDSRASSVPGTPRILSWPKKKKNRAAQAARLRRELKQLVDLTSPRSKRMYGMRRQTM